MFRIMPAAPEEFSTRPSPPALQWEECPFPHPPARSPSIPTMDYNEVHLRTRAEYAEKRSCAVAESQRMLEELIQEICGRLADPSAAKSVVFLSIKFLGLVHKLESLVDYGDIRGFIYFHQDAEGQAIWKTIVSDHFINYGCAAIDLHIQLFQLFLAIENSSKVLEETLKRRFNTLLEWLLKFYDSQFEECRAFCETLNDQPNFYLSIFQRIAAAIQPAQQIGLCDAATVAAVNQRIAFFEKPLAPLISIENATDIEQINMRILQGWYLSGFYLKDNHYYSPQYSDALRAQAFLTTYFLLSAHRVPLIAQEFMSAEIFAQWMQQLQPQLFQNIESLFLSTEEKSLSVDFLQETLPAEFVATHRTKWGPFMAQIVSNDGSTAKRCEYFIEWVTEKNSPEEKKQFFLLCLENSKWTPVNQNFKNFVETQVRNLLMDEMQGQPEEQKINFLLALFTENDVLKNPNDAVLLTTLLENIINPMILSYQAFSSRGNAVPQGRRLTVFSLASTTGRSPLLASAAEADYLEGLDEAETLKKAMPYLQESTQAQLQQLLAPIKKEKPQQCCMM